MNQPPRTTQTYLQVGADPVLVFLHDAGTHCRRDTAVLVCPPFGWEEICSYRSRRDWAAHLAKAGYPTMRIDLPGTGDSGGTAQDADLLGRWTSAVTVATDHLREHAGCATIAAIGIGLGGLVLCNAISERAAIDELVLWGTPARGRTFIRELRAFARLQEEQAGPSADGCQKSDDLAVGGFLLTGETLNAIEDIDLTQVAPPRPAVGRALLLERDGMKVDSRLRSCLAAWGTDATTAAGQGYGAMIAKPHLARPPRGVFAQVSEWLDAGSRDAACASDYAVVAGDKHDAVATAEIDVDGVRIAESTLLVTQPLGKLFGTLATPLRRVQAADLCAVLLNAGAIRRVGPNRMWVEAARRWAARGIPTLRLDVEGIGDADGDGERFGDLAELYTDELVAQVRAALDMLEEDGHGRRFVVGGLCSGACWSFQTALQDERVIAALLLNPRALFWHPSLETERELRRGVFRASSWRKVIAGTVPPARLAEVATKAPAAPIELTRRAFERRRTRRGGADELGDALDRLRDEEKSLLFLFSGDEPLREELERDGYVARAEQWPNIEFGALPGRDHTLRPAAAQRRAHELLDAAVDRLTKSPTAG